MEDVNISAMIQKQAMFVPAIQDIHCKQIDIVVSVSFDSYQKQNNRLATASMNKFSFERYCIDLMYRATFFQLKITVPLMAVCDW